VQPVAVNSAPQTAPEPGDGDGDALVRLCCGYGDRAQIRTASFVAIGLALTAGIKQ
jgi:hypothetical protein